MYVTDRRERPGEWSRLLVAHDERIRRRFDRFSRVRSRPAWQRIPRFIAYDRVDLESRPSALSGPVAMDEASRDLAPPSATMNASEQSSVNDIRKAGHLKKQGGARGGRKNWKRRWVVLKSEYICYFGEKENGTSEDGPCLGVVPLRGAKVFRQRAMSVQLAPPNAFMAQIVSVEAIADETQLASDTPQSSSAAQLPTTCYQCHKANSSRIHCKSCQNVFCEACAAENQMIGDKATRVCSFCRHRHADEDTIAMAATASNMEIGSVVEVVYREAKNTVFFKKEKPQYLFAIRTKERELWLAAEDAQEKAAWVTAISEVIVSYKKAFNNANSATAGNQAEKEQKQDGKATGSPSQQWEIDYNQITILEKIGDGAFGEVFKGRLWGTDVAVKTIKADQVTESVVDDLKKEVAILSQLRHPNVVLYIGACTKPPNVCIVTEWCDKGSLHDVLHDSSIPLDIQRIVSLSVGIAQGINYLHSLERRIIHRDLKSHNVLVDRNFNVKVADFGLSHVRESLTQQNGTSALNNDTNGRARANAFTAAAPQQLGAPADFQSMKINSESMGGHYGVFGTPEWMAPEIMEGTAYNQKVDVYSFGIMMSEILTRKLPFRDQYKIKSYMDVVDAVLDDGAMPTLPGWIGLRLKRLIESCLSRNSSARPSFMSIILKLRSMFSASPAELFQTYDLPRLHDMLATPDRHNQALAAKEIASFKFEQEACPAGCDDDIVIREIDMAKRVCARCRYSAAHHQKLDDAVVTQFIGKLTDMLASSSGKVVLPAVEALERLITGGQRKSSTKLRQENLSIIKERNGIERLLGLVSSRSPQLSEAASSCLMLLIEDLPVDDSSYKQLKGTSLHVLSAMMEKDIAQRRDENAQMTEQLRNKVKTFETLQRLVQAAQIQQQPPSSSENVLEDRPMLSSSQRRRPKSPLQVPINPAATLATAAVTDQWSDQATVVAAVAAVPAPVITVQKPPDAPARPDPGPRFTSKGSTAVVRPPARETAPDDMPIVALDETPTNNLDTASSSAVPSASVPSTPGPSDPADDDGTGSPRNTAPEAVQQLVRPQTPDVPLPGRFQRISPANGDWVFVHDAQLGEWILKYVIVMPSMICVFRSYDDVEQTRPPEATVNASVPPGKRLKFKTGRKFRQPWCFHLCSQGQKWWFSLRSSQHTEIWSDVIVRPLLPDALREAFGATQQTLLRPGGNSPQLSPRLDEMSADDAVNIEGPNRTQSAQSIAAQAPGVASPGTVDQPTSAVDQPIPATEQPGSPAVAVEQPAPAVEQPAPVVEQPAPVVEQPAPVVEQPAPVVEQPVPVIEQPEPVAEVASPAVAEAPRTMRTSVPVVPALEAAFDARGTSLVSRGSAEHPVVEFEEADTSTTQLLDIPMLEAEAEPLVMQSPVSMAAHLESVTPAFGSTLSLDALAKADQGPPESEAQGSSKAPADAGATKRLSTVAATDTGDKSPPVALPTSSNRPQVINQAPEPTPSGAPATRRDTSPARDVPTQERVSEQTTTSEAAGAPPSTEPRSVDVSPVPLSSDPVAASSSSPHRQLEPASAVARAHGVEPASRDSPVVSPKEVAAGKFVKRYIETTGARSPMLKPNQRLLSLRPGNELSRGNAALRLAAMPEVTSLPPTFVEQFGRRDCWHYSYLIMPDRLSQQWVAKFVVLLGAQPIRLMVYNSHNDPPQKPVSEHLLEEASAATSQAVEACLGFPVEYDEKIALVVKEKPAQTNTTEPSRPLLFLCASETDRHKWLSLIQRVVALSRV
ncbi:Protein kinase domain containing protein [Plasmodiophora brassicae]